MKVVLGEIDVSAVALPGSPLESDGEGVLASHPWDSDEEDELDNEPLVPATVPASIRALRALVAQALGRCPLSWRPHVDFLCSRGDRLFHQASASPLPFSSPVSSGALPLVLSPSLTILPPFSNSTCLHCWCHLLGWPSASPVVAEHWELGVGDALHLALERTFSLFGRFAVAPPVALRSRPLCSGSPRLRWVLGHIGARLLSTLSPSRFPPTWASLLALRPRHSTGGSPEKSILVSTVPFVTGSLPWSLTHMASLSTLSLATSSLSGRTLCTPSTCLPLPFVCGVLRAGAMTLPAGVPLVIGRVPPPAPFAMTQTAPSCITFPLVLPTTMPELPGHTPAASLRRMFPRLHGTGVFNPVDESNSPQTIRAHIRFVGLCERLQPPSW